MAKAVSDALEEADNEVLRLQDALEEALQCNAEGLKACSLLEAEVDKLKKEAALEREQLAAARGTMPLGRPQLDGP